MSPRLDTLCFIPLSTTTKANATTAAQKVKEQYNTIFTYMCSHRSPKMSLSTSLQSKQRKIQSM